jgi:hypothetical protein
VEQHCSPRKGCGVTLSALLRLPGPPVFSILSPIATGARRPVANGDFAARRQCLRTNGSVEGGRFGLTADQRFARLAKINAFFERPLPPLPRALDLLLRAAALAAVVQLAVAVPGEVLRFTAAYEGAAESAVRPYAAWAYILTCYVLLALTTASALRPRRCVRFLREHTSLAVWPVFALVLARCVLSLRFLF